MPQARDEAGNIWETDAQGNPVRLIQAAPQQGQVFADPVAPFEVPKAQADIANVQTNIADTRADNAREDTKLRAELLKQGLRIGANGQPERIPGFKPVVDPPDPLKLSQFRALEQQIARVEELFRAGPGSTTGVRGLKDFVPDALSDANAAFNSAAAGLGEVGLAAFRVPGVGSQSDAELRQFVAANTPRAGDRDAAILEKLGNLKRRLAATKQELGIAVEAMPEAIPEPLAAAGQGAAEAAIPIPPEMQQEHAAWIAQNAGQITPDSYTAFRTALDRKFGFEPNTAAYRQAAPAINEGSLQGQIDAAIPPVNRELSAAEQFRNNLVSNPAGATAVNFLDTAGFGGVSALAGDQVGALNEANPTSALLGQLGGAITGTAALGRLGRETVGRALPGLLGGGKKAQFARNIATDSVFSGVLGANQGQDALDSAVFGGLGSAAGGLAGKAIGKTIGGADLSEAVQALRARGIPLTTGQTLGGIPKAFEDRLTSAPFIGDIAQARRGEGLEAFNRAAFQDAGAPIGFSPTGIGQAGVQDLRQATGQAFDTATAGVSVPLDPQFNLDMADVAALRNTLPDDFAARFDKIGQNRIGPIVDRGELTGETFQQAVRGLRGARSQARAAAPGFEQEFKDALTSAQDVLTAQMQRGGGQQVVEGLGRANQAFRLGKIVEDATQRADGTNFTFTPSQLQDAIKLSNKKFPGDNPLAALANAGQQVLPSRIPDSGTGGRLAQLALPGAIVGGGSIGALGGAGGGLEGAQSGAQTGALSTASLIAALAFLGTKGGQKALNNIIATRPDSARQIGRTIGRNAGIFGSATIPLTVGNQ